MTTENTTSTKLDHLEAVKQALLDSATFSQNNGLMAEETVKVDLHLDHASKSSTLTYSGPEGTFKVKYDPQKQQATADVDFHTGKYKATVTKDSIQTKGVSPVYHRLWGTLHKAFHP